MVRQALRIRLCGFTFSLLILCASLLCASSSLGQSVSGTVINNSLWENSQTNEPAYPNHWYVSDSLGPVSNGNGRALVALFDAGNEFLPMVDTAILAPTNALVTTNLVAIQGGNWTYELGDFLAAGDYIVTAWVDGNGNWLPDVGEPQGERRVTVSEDSSVQNVIVNIEDDTDGDGFEDWWEMHWFGSLAQTRGTDFDNDGLTDGQEYGLIQGLLYVHPNHWDTDRDGMDDAWERFYHLDPTSFVYTNVSSNTNGPYGDPDGDTIINIDEYNGPDGIGWRAANGTNGIAMFTTSRDAMNPIRRDSDRDGVDDAGEFLEDLTHPTHSMSSTNFYPRSLQMSVGGTNGVDITDPTGTTYAFGKGGGTVEFWIRPGAVGDGIIYGFTNVTAGVPHFRISLEDYRPRMDILNGVNIMATVGGIGPDGSVQQLESNEWSHVACVIAPQNNSLDLYVDGVLLIAQKSFIKPDFILGSPTICQGFTDGYIDELRIWSYPRAAADIEYWSERIYPAPGYVREWASTLSGRTVQMYEYVNPRPLIGYFRFDDGGPLVENYAFINYGLYPYRTAYYLGATVAASVTTDQAVPMSGSDDADGDGLPEWWVEIHNLEKYHEYYSRAYGPVYVPCPDDAALVDGFEYFRAFIGYGSVGTHLGRKDSPESDLFHYPKTRPDFYCGDRSSYTRYVYLFAQPLECPLNVYTPGMVSTIIYVNGTRVTTSGDEANTGQSYDLAQYMQLGRNQIHVECVSEVARSVYDAAGNIATVSYTISDYQAYDSRLVGQPYGCNNTPYEFRVATGKFDADLTCNGVPMVVRGDESRADPRAVWHCQVWSEFYERKWTVPIPDQENRAVPGNTDYGVPLNAERDNNPLDPDSADDDLDAVYEYITGVNPRDRDSNNNGVGDGDEDFDMDGLVNREEQRFGSDPWLPDTDDDGLIDGSDVGAAGHPAQSLSPQNNLSVCFGGGVDDFIEFPIRQRFALSKWTIEGWIRPDADEVDGGILMQRSVSSNGVNYEVGLTTSNTPYARYVSIGGAEVRADSATAVPADGSSWTHLAASYYDRDLVLYVNGSNVAATTGSAFPALYAGGPITQNAGAGFKGCIDELRLWGEERSLEEILLKRDEVLTGLEDTLVAYYRFDDNTSYSTNPPALVGTSANNGTNGAAATVPWEWGQVEDNVLRYSADWQHQWDHAASFSGNVDFSTNHIIVGPPRLQVFLEPDDAVTAGAAWSHNGGAAWNDSGYLEPRLSPGDFEISFQEVDGWIAPDIANVTLVRGQSTIVTGVYQQTASLTVIIDNDTQIKTEATWSIDGGVTDHGTGTRIDGLTPGTPGYDIIFSDISATVPGWDPPSTIHVELLEAEERTVTASYTPVRGGLQISFIAEGGPANPPSEARWRVSGNSNWFGSGEIVTNLNYGEHTVEYNTVEWWEAPGDEIIVIEDSTLSALERVWTKLDEPNRIGVVLTPSSVVVAGAQWHMNGVTYNSGETVVVSAGTYNVSFDDIDGYLTPLEMELYADSESVAVTGAYYRADLLGAGRGHVLGAPHGVAANQRFLFVADAERHQVRVLDTFSGVWGAYGVSEGSAPGAFSQPLGVDLDPNGDLWVADTGNHRIQRLSATLNAWTSFGSWGGALGQFNAPYDVEVDGIQNVFVADYHNSRVQRMGASGGWSAFVAGGVDPGRVRFPSGLAVADDNTVYVSDYDPAGGAGGVTRIQHFTTLGVPIARVGFSGVGEGELSRTRGMAMQSATDLLVADTENDEVKLRSPSAGWSEVIGSGRLDSPRDVAVDPWGNVYIADTGNDRVVRLPAADGDGDGLPDNVEPSLGADPANPDSDGDSFNDRREVNAGSDPGSALVVPNCMPLDYAGDNVDDVVSYNGGWWHILMSDVAQHWSDSYKWGTDVDWPVSGDFDDDGIGDLGVYRPSSGMWYVQGTLGSSSVQKWGIAGDVPIAGDFDGDWIADHAVFRPGGWWAVLPSAGAGGYKVKWGIAGDIPVAGDYDGDGMTDTAVFRPTTGWWYVNGSTAGFITQKWGIPGDIPVPGDYDNDDTTDFAVYRGGFWIVRQSSTLTSLVRKWGIPGDTPVPGDYDGNGQDNLAVFRGSAETWIISLDAGGRLDVPVSDTGALPVHPQYRINRHFGLAP